MITQVWGFLHQPSNARLLEQAFKGGHLSQLREIELHVGPALDAICRGLLQAPPVIQQRQAQVHSLAIWASHDHQLDGDSLGAMLRLPLFAQLKAIDLSIYTEEEQGPAFDALAQYIQHVGGAPSLGCLCLFAQGGLVSLLQALVAEGGAPNLQELTLVDADCKAFEDVGVIFRAGGLPHLHSLTFGDPDLGPRGIRAFFSGASMSQHRGASLISLKIAYEQHRGRYHYDMVAEIIDYMKQKFSEAQDRGTFSHAIPECWPPAE
jgi:hypothetical protein